MKKILLIIIPIFNIYFSFCQDVISIKSIEDFNKIYTEYNKSFVLENNIDFKGSNIKSIGLFSGNFDGKGYTLSNFNIHSYNISVGLFAKLSKAKIINLNLENVNITGKEKVGGLAGEIENSLVENVSFSGNIVGKETVGGLVGFSNESTITNSYFSGDIKGKSEIGGLVGEIYNSKVYSCYSMSNISGYKNIGGLVGLMDNNSIINSCYSLSTIKGDENIGSLIGKTKDEIFHIKNSYSNFINNTDYIGCIKKCSNKFLLNSDLLIKKGQLVNNFIINDWVFENGFYPILKNLDILKQKNIHSKYSYF